VKENLLENLNVFDSRKAQQPKEIVKMTPELRKELAPKCTIENKTDEVIIRQ